MAGGGGGARRDLAERPRAFADGPLDRLVFDVVAAAHGLETADGRVLLVGSVHVGEANTFNLLPLPCTMRAARRWNFDRVLALVPLPTRSWGHSSAGRAPEWHSGGQG